MRALHLTSESCWQSIQNTSLEPRSHLILPEWKIDYPDIMIPDTQFLFAYFTHPEKTLYEEVHFQAMQDWYREKYQGEALVLLSFLVLESDEAYVVEAKHTIAPYHRRHNPTKMFELYETSMVPLARYENDYKCPELLFINPIPRERITLEHRITEL